jgi:DNA-binding LacI/PurR family transcriptional regulator
MTTIKEIAEKTGFSLSTVSVVLSGNGEARHIPEHTQKVIFDAARSMGYSPNLSARRLRSSNIKKTILVYWANDYRATLVFRFLQGLYRYLEQKKSVYEVVIHPFTPGTLKKKASLAELSVYSAAVICTASTKDIAYLENIPVPTPIILYNRYSEKFSNVVVDNCGIGKGAAKWLWDRGKNSAVILAAEKNMPFISERVMSFVETFESFGGATKLFEAENNTLNAAFESASLINFSNHKQLGIFCTSDILALGVLKQMDEKKISRSNVDIICIGTLNKEITSFILHGSRVIEVPIEEMGYKCIELVDQTVEGKILSPVSVTVSVNFSIS